MSKIGMKPISFAKMKIDVASEGLVSGVLGSDRFEYQLPRELDAVVANNKLAIKVKPDFAKRKKVSMIWGLHRALLANKIKGLEDGFVSNVRIVGLGFKAALEGSKVVMTLGYSHKISFELDSAVKLEIDKTGQNLVLRSKDKLKLGDVCAHLRSLRPPEPYKGTGIIVNNERIIRKSGKAKS